MKKPELAIIGGVAGALLNAIFKAVNYEMLGICYGSCEGKF